MTLIGQWLFDDLGTPGLDSSATGNNASFVGDANVSGGRAQFDGAGDFVEIADDAAYALTSGTVAVQFNANALSGTQGIVSRDSSGFDGGGHFTIYLRSNGRIQVRHQSDSNSYYVQTNTGFVTPGQDYELVYNWDATNGQELYINGVQIDTNADSVTDGADLSLGGNNEPWTVGASQQSSGDGTSSGTNDFFDGTVEYFELYDANLTATEVVEAQVTITDLTDLSDDGTIAGTANDDTIFGGNDSLSGDGGLVVDDTIDGGAGNDIIYAGDGNDSVDAGSGNDSVSGGGGNDLIYAGAGADTVSAGAGDDTVYDSGNATSPTLVSAETFEGGATGWSSNTTDNSESASLSEFLGRLGGSGGAQGISKTYNLDTSKSHAVIEFDLYRIDSWDNEDFVIFVDDTQISSKTFGSSAAGDETDVLTVGGTDYTVTYTATSGMTDLGFISYMDDQSFRVRIEVENPAGSSLKLGFGSTLDSATTDESYGIDNVAVVSADSVGVNVADAAASSDDSIDGGAGNDTLVAYDGNDTLVGGVGNDTLSGGDGNDSLSGGDDTDVLYGGGDEDSLDGGHGNDLLYGGTGDDEIQGGYGDDTLIGGDGADTIDGGMGRNLIYGGAGDDLLSGAEDGNISDAAAVTIYGGSGNDSITSVRDTTTTNDEDIFVYGGVGDDTILLNSDDTGETAFGGAGDDVITSRDKPYSGSANYTDSIDGGTGNDSIDAGDRDDNVSGGSGNDTLAGGTGDDTLTGGSGNDTVYGGDGDDLMLFEDGFDADTIYGGEGGTDRDTLDLSALGAGVTVTYTGDEQGTFTDGMDTGAFYGIENVVLTDQNDQVDASANAAGVTLDARGGDDIVSAGQGNDSIDLGSGSDRVYGNLGVDTFDGGLGDDTVSYYNSDAGVDVDVSDADAESGGHADGDVLTGFEQLDGSNGHGDTLTADNSGMSLYGHGGDDTLTGGTAVDTLAGGGGNDTLIGGAGDDRLEGATGNDTIQGGAGADAIQGGDGADVFVLEDGFGADTIYGGEGGSDLDTLDLSALGAGVTVTYTGDEEGTFTDGTDTGTFYGIESIVLTEQDDDFDASNDTLGISVDGLGGNDTLTGGDGSDTVEGGSGNDSISSGGGSDLVYGGADADTIDAGISTDTVYGGAGDDSIDANNADDTVYGGTGNDSIDGGNSDDLIYGGAGDDSIDGGTHDDLIYGGDGNDNIDTGNLTDTAYGGAGNDTLVNGSGGTSQATLYGGTGNDTLETGTGDAADVLFGGAGDDVLNDRGTDGNQTLDGGAGADTITAAGGDDLVYGGDDQDTFALGDSFGADTIYGGESGTDNDTLDFSALGTGVTVTFTSDEQGTFTDGTDTGTFFEVENVVLTEQDDDFDASNDMVGVSVDGRAGNDALTGGAGADTFVGGDGRDNIDGGAEGDLIYGGNQYDILDGATGDDTIYGGADADDAYAAAGNDAVFGDTGNDWLFGETGNDSVFGGAGNDNAYAGLGNDTIDGGAGNDRVEGDGGADLVYGGTGDDTVLGDGEADTVYGGDGLDEAYGGSGDDTIYAGDGDDTATGLSGNDTVFGDDGNDSVGGHSGNDTIYGGVGNDTLVGGFDTDTLFGGTGNDTLTGGGGNDTLTGGGDDDTFVLSASGGDDTITDFGTGNDQLDTSALTDVGNALTNQDGTVTADEVTVTGGGGSDQVLTFPNGESLTVSDGTVDTSTPATQFASLVAMGVPPCFAPGTLIGTAQGPTPVELLRPGDLIETADRGLQPLLWTGRREVAFDAENPRGDRDKPILIAKGALGDGLPRRDLIVSPQHRMVLAGQAVVEHFGEREILALAKALTGLPGVRVMRGKRQITYHALLLARHEVIFAEGAPTESFRPGPVALESFAPHHRAQIHRLYPGLADDPERALGPPARQIPRRADVVAAIRERNVARTIRLDHPITSKLRRPMAFCTS